MIRVLMCGPIATSGGVSTHTKNLTNELSKLEVKIKIYNLFFNKNNILLINDFIKLYLRTIGLVIESLKSSKNYDLIHIQASGGIFSFISANTGALISSVLGKKLVITFHYSQTEKFLKKYPIIFRLVLHLANAMIVVSYQQKNAILNAFPNYSSKLFVIPNGYKSELFFQKNKSLCKEMLHIPDEKKIILNISNLIDTKGHKYLIEAISYLSKSRSDFVCCIIGQGYLEEELRNLIGQFDLRDYIRLIGWRPDEEIPIWMSASHVFALPSLAEGNPTVMFEALGSGLPFVGTNVGGIPEIIVSEEYGYICKLRDPKDLADKLNSSLDKQWQIDKIINYSKDYMWSTISNETLNIYRSIL